MKNFFSMLANVHINTSLCESSRLLSQLTVSQQTTLQIILPSFINLGIIDKSIIKILMKNSKDDIKEYFLLYFLLFIYFFIQLKIVIYTQTYQ